MMWLTESLHSVEAKGEIGIRVPAINGFFLSAIIHLLIASER